MALTPVVLDISHHQDLEDDAFEKMKAEGIQGVILKCTEGSGYVDKTYAARRKACEDAGLLVGSYHFARGGSPEAQAEHFLRHAKVDGSLLLALDWEDKAMGTAAARRFLNAVMAKTGRRPDQVWIYGGHVPRELIKTKADRQFFGQFPLWLCHYTQPERIKIPSAWKSYKLWQYSDKGHFAGVKKGGSVDLNVFGGKNLKAEWAAGPKPAAVPVEMPSVPEKKVTPTDLVPVSRKAWSLNKFKRVWQGITVTGILTALGMAKSTADQVGQVVKDNWLIIVITLAVLLVLFAKWIESLMAEDVNEGRAVPSGGMPS